MNGARLRLLPILFIVSVLKAHAAVSVAPSSATTKPAAPKIDFREQPDFVLYRQTEQRWDRELHRALGLPEGMELALTHRDRFETVTNPWRRGQSSDTDTQLVQRTRLRIGLNDDGPVRALFEGQDSRLFGHDAGEFFGTSVEDHADILQAFVSGTWKDTFGSKLRTDVHLGRFTFEYASTRLIGRNVLPNATNAFDGIHVNVANGARWRGRAFYTRPVDRREDEPDHSSDKKIFWGAIFEQNVDPDRLLDLAYLRLDDDLAVAVPAQSHFSTYDFRVRREWLKPEGLKKMKTFGALDYELESAYETGDKGGKDFEAAMLHGEMGYTWNRRWYPRLTAWADYASGSKNPAGPHNTTFDRLFGLRDNDLGATADYGPFPRSNIVSRSLRLEVRPRTDLRIFFKHAWRQLDQARDAFSGSSLTGFAALRDPSGRAGTDLGHDTELAFVRQIALNTLIDLRWAHWWKGKYFDNLPASAGLPKGGNEDTDFVMAGVERRF